MTKMFLWLAIIALAGCVYSTFIDDPSWAVMNGGLAAMWLIVDVAHLAIRRD